jgi:REP element-mobilizing transposase RayT
MLPAADQCRQRQRIFQRTANAELMVTTLFRYRDQGRFALHAFVMMPDHIHLLITPAQHRSTSACLQLIKGGYSFAVRKQFPGEVWPAGYHEHRVRDSQDFEAQKNYIANNRSEKVMRTIPTFISTTLNSSTPATSFHNPPNTNGVPPIQPPAIKIEAVRST